MGQGEGDSKGGGVPTRRVSAAVLTYPWWGCSEENKPMVAAAWIADGPDVQIGGRRLVGRG